MKIILIKDVKKVGRKFEIKDVADGFAINSLIPSGSALPATEGNIRSVESRKVKDTLSKEEFEKGLESAVAKLKDGKLLILGKVNDKGHLFAGIHKEQIIEEFKKQTGTELPLDIFELEKPIKEVGEQTVNLKVNGKSFEIKLLIKAESI
ncbi:MAG: 50S ribosomal protein L9 [Candidatus Paceibacterota bacterium]|jgi:large subunit ribosomal protein L9